MDDFLKSKGRKERQNGSCAGCCSLQVMPSQSLCQPHGIGGNGALYYKTCAHTAVAFLLHHLCYFSSFLSPLTADCSHRSLLSLSLPSSVHLSPLSSELLWHRPFVAWGGERWEQGRADHLSGTRNQQSSTSETRVSGSGCCPGVNRTEEAGYRWSQSVLMAFLGCSGRALQPKLKEILQLILPTG